VPSTRDLIFWNAISRATSGDPCFGFSSMLKGEKPQSSVEPSRSFWDVLRGEQKIFADFLRRLDAPVQWKRNMVSSKAKNGFNCVS
jgi:hypothetical protein